MATTQYIGARYVPLFFTNPDDNSNNWKSGVAYDPLTVVTDLNQSYTSKIPVPASIGRPSDNPTYWILTGAYSAQIEQYRQEVEELRENVLRKMRDRVFLFICDSFAFQPTYEAAWVAKTIEALDIPTSRYEIIGQGGYGFASPNKFYTLLTNHEFVIDPTTFTDIIIGAGWNDIGQTYNAIETNMTTCIEWLHANVPNAEISVACMCHNMSSDNLDTKWRRNYIPECYNAVAAKNGCKVISGIEFVLHDRALLNLSDNPYTHPNAAGGTAIANAMVSAMQGGSVFDGVRTSGYGPNVLTLTNFTSSNFGTVSNFGMKEYRTKESVSIAAGYDTTFLAASDLSSVNIPAFATQKIGTLTGLRFLNSIGRHAPCRCIINPWGNPDSSKNHIMEGFIYFDNMDVLLQPTYPFTGYTNCQILTVQETFTMTEC